MKFLHLTDLHMGKPTGAQDIALGALLDDIRLHVPDGIDVVLMTGDLAYSGESAEYDRLNKVVIEPLRGLPNVGGATFVAAPGNHDLNARATLPMCSWEELGRKRQDVFFDDSDEGRQTRASRTGGFAAYSAFLKTYKILGVDPLQSVCARIDLGKIEVYSINTSLFSDPATTDLNRSYAPTSALRAAVKDRDRSKRMIVIGHHPVDWFSRQSQAPFKALLQQHGATYIHGHIHEIVPQWVSSGLLTFGLGAVYQDSLDRANVVYRNGYAYGEIGDSLHLVVRQWDAVNGVWNTGPLPVDFKSHSSRLPSGFELQLQSVEAQRPIARSEKASRNAPRITSVLCTTSPRATDWQTILKSAELVGRDAKLRTLTDNTAGHSDFAAPDPTGQARIHCISGPGHVLSASALEAQNTLFDTEDFSALLLVSLGTIAEDASKLATRLGRKKALRVLGNSDLAAELDARLMHRFSAGLQSFDAADVTATAVFDNGEWSVLVVDRLNQSWFVVLKEAGGTADETDDCVARVRSEHPQLAHSAYRGSSGNVSIPVQTPFERQSYLAKCKRDFDSLQYGGLAAVGIRLPTSRLSDVYVSPTVDVSQRGDAADAYQRAVSEALDSLNLDAAQRAQLEAQLRSSNPALSPRETRGARLVYQQHGSVAVLGDPGSGKTSFVKTEIIAYCDPPAASHSWYSSHTPVYVPLAEAAALFAGGNDLFSIAATLAVRRGLPLTKTHVEQLAASGQVAFFFDGLDEIAAVEARASLMEAIRDFVHRWAVKGNRFVLTSRPAAVNMIQLPDELVPLRLRGLTESEIELLVRKMFSMEFKSDLSSIKFSTSEGDAAKKELVDRILRDCADNNGIKRLASNPLLLTLLVMIYANSGPLAAKKHRVYGQAVQTLVTVRNRVPGGTVFSEADLRRHLGYVALSLFLNQRVDIPARVDFEQLVVESLKNERRPGDLAQEARKFVQSVAESTGLLVLHEHGSPSGGASVSFMHHSFFEYYVAQGILAAGKSDLLREHVLEPRWREVAEIAAGLVGDVADVTPMIKSLLYGQSDAELISGERLLFAVDCALECDVPPVATQDVIAEAVFGAVATGSALYDSELRASLGDRLAQFLDATGSTSIRQMLASGLSDERADVCAAFVDLVGAVGASFDIEIEPSLLERFAAASMREDVAVRISVLGALVVAPSLRTAGTLRVLKEGFRGPIALKVAAVKAAEREPRLAKEVWDDLLISLDANSPAISSAAARALLEGGLDVGGSQNRSLVEKCLRLWAITRREGNDRKLSISVSREHVSELLSSDSANDRVLGIRLLPWLERDEVFVVSELMSAIRQRTDLELRRAALTSLRQSERACAALTLADVDELSELLNFKERGIRIASARVLAAVQAEHVVKPLLMYVRRSKNEEFREALKALVRNRGRVDAVRKYVANETLLRVKAPGAGAFGDENKQAEIRTLLRCCEQLSGDVPRDLQQRLLAVANSFKTPDAIRRLAVRAFAKVAPPRPASLLVLIGWVKAGGSFGASIGDAVLAFLRKSRAKVGHVRELIPLLPELILQLTAAWKRVYVVSSSGQQPALKSLRLALREAEGMHSAYSEFARIRRAS